MSELDYELASLPSPDIVELYEAEENEINKSCVCEPSKMSSPEIIDLCQTEESDAELLDTNEIFKCSQLVKMHSSETIGVSQTEENEVKVGSKSNETYSDLEDGEIKEPVDECNDKDPEICQYFQKGNCFLDKHCRFRHIKDNSYKMFESNITNPSALVLKALPVYNPAEISHFTQEPPNSWVKGFEEAKKLVLRAKLKKETDLDFEEKQLYQGLDDDKIIESSHKRKIVLSEKRKKTPRKNSGLKGKPEKVIPDETLCSRFHKKAKSMTSNRANLWSSHRNRSLSPNSTSTCSEYASSYCSCKSKNHHRKTKSKLERAFSKALDTPEASRSRKKLSSRRTFPSYPRKRSLSKSSFIKRFIYRSYSKSPSPSKKVKTEKQLERDCTYKPLHKQTTSLSETRRKQTSFYSEKERDSTPFSKLLSENNSDWLESCSSDMTVSSLKCTSVSCASSEENSSVISSRKVSVGKGINVNRKNELKVSHDVKKWLNSNSVAKSVSETKEFNTEISNKTGEKTNKSLKYPKNHITHSKPNPKHSSWSTSDDELSADELELLKYIPSKDEKLKHKENKFSNNIKEAKPTVKPSLQHISPKVACNFGSDIESSTKFVHNCEPNEENFKSSKTHNGQNMNEDGTNGGNNLIKESIKTQQAKTTSSQKSNSIAQRNWSSIESLDASPSKSDQQNNFSRLNSSKRRRSSSESSSDERQYSADELELLKYVSIGNPTVSKAIQKQRRKNPPLASKKTQQTKRSKSADSKPSCHKSAVLKKPRTTKMSRREQLMKQLEAVELAIAKKKQLLKLESQT